MKPNQQEKCAHKKNLGESCSQCNEAWNDMTSPHQEGWEERFDEKFTYLDENGDRYLLGSFDKDKNISTDNIPDIKSFIRQELTTLHKADCERFRDILSMDNPYPEDVFPGENGRLLRTAFEACRLTAQNALQKFEEEK